jgi:hypothetical protein
MDQTENESGIFFSSWIEEEAARRNRANYNIHALKLRHLKGYSITSRDFANEFRDNFETIRGIWPDVSVDYGPLTLMQGWLEVDPHRFEEDIPVLLERFKHITPLIDRLLGSRRK